MVFFIEYENNCFDIWVDLGVWSCSVIVFIVVGDIVFIVVNLDCFRIVDG